jgi:CheY-like chemotaxis protein
LCRGLGHAKMSKVLQQGFVLKRILFIEDDEDIRHIIQSHIINSFDVDVVAVESGNKAIELLKNDLGFVLIISDYMMADGMGIDVLNFKISQKLEIPFVFFTNTVDPHIPFNKCEYLGVVDKWRGEDLLKLIGTLINE